MSRITELMTLALGVAVQLSLSMPLEEIMTYRKVGSAVQLEPGLKPNHVWFQCLKPTYLYDEFLSNFAFSLNAVRPYTRVAAASG